MKIYTKKGDTGQTSLVGGQRVSKGECRIEAYGTLDELCAHLGFMSSSDFFAGVVPPGILLQLHEIISRVMDCSAIVASVDFSLEKLPQITSLNVEDLERWCDELLVGLPQLRYFTLPIGSQAMSYTHICRTVTRRAERHMVRALEGGAKFPGEVLGYVNRLSDYLYALSRYLQHNSSSKEVLWVPSSKK